MLTTNDINVIQQGSIFKIPLDKSFQNIMNQEEKENLSNSTKQSIDHILKDKEFSSLYSNLKNEKIKNDLEIDDALDKIINEQEQLKFFVNNNSEIIEALTNYQVLKEKNNLLRKIKNFLKKLKISKELISYIINAIQKYEINKNSININEVNEFIQNQINEKRKTRKILRNIFDKVIIFSKQIGFID
jgi:hypothetical protein